MREVWFEQDGTRLFAVEDGDGPAVLTVHGLMADHSAALPQVARLSSRYRVVAPDLRGSGKSWHAGPLAFDQLADDLEALLDELGIERAIVGGVSSSTGVALRLALRHPSRVAALILVHPVYAGEQHGYTEEQQATFARMDGVASRALQEGVQVLRPLYAELPPEIRDRALAMIAAFDPASVVTTSRFIASGAQPFARPEDLRSVQAPTLVVRGDDPLHPAATSDLYVDHIPDCRALPAETADVADAIGRFCDESAGESG